MKKKIILLQLCFVFSILLKAQTITPLQTAEVCPNTEYIFGVTLPGLCSKILVYPTAQNVAPQVTQGPFNISPNSNATGFNFRGKFADYNDKQTFTVQYNNANNVTVTFPAQFIKIKSLRNPNSFSQIYLNAYNITSPICQVTTHNINFANVQYGNPTEAPPIGYGTIFTYEYLLPNGWQLNGNASNGTTWMPGGNNVTVTSDISNGNGQYISVRATNNACGAGLVAGQISN